MKENTIISPSQFKAALQSVLENPAMHKRLYDRWCGNQKPYTNEWETKIYSRLAEKLNLDLSLEYGRIDAVFHTEDSYCKYNKYKKDGEDFWNISFLSVIMEHENFVKGSCHEINVLLRHNASLKVLVTYPETMDDGKEWLGKYAEQIQAADFLGDSARQRCLVVFGYWNEQHPLCWEYHLYEKGGFVKMD